MTKTRDLADLGGGFIQAGTGAVQRTVESKLQDVVSVKDFGAVGDGVADDTVAIQAAITAVKGTGSILRFGNGTFRLSKTSTISFGSPGIHSYSLIVDNTLHVDAAGATFLVPVDDASLTNGIVFNGVSNSTWVGGRFVGTNPSGGTTRILYEGIALALHNCNNCSISSIETEDMRASAVSLYCTSCSINNSTGKRITGALHNQGFFTIYGSYQCRISDCHTWGGCDDGDIFMYGAGSYNKIQGCSAWNCLFGDATYAILSTTNQGLGADSQQNYSVIENCYAYGHFYGIDAKTNSTYVRLINNTAIRCKIGLSSRRGEGNAAVCTVEMRGNEIRPGSGNGNTTPLLGAATHCIVAEDTSSLSIANNTLGVSYEDGVCNFVGITVVAGDGSIDTSAIFAQNSPGLHIVNNNFVFQQKFAAFDSYSTGTILNFDGQMNSATDQGGQFYQIKFNNNSVNPYLGITVPTVVCRDTVSVQIQNNNFGICAGTGPVVLLERVFNTQFTGNTFETQPIALDLTFPTNAESPNITMMQGVIVSNNIFGKGTASANTLLNISGEGAVVVTGNVWYRQQKTAALDEGRVLNVSNQTRENLVFVNNSFNISSVPSTYYTLNGVNAKTGANIIVSNVLNP